MTQATVVDPGTTNLRAMARTGDTERKRADRTRRPPLPPGELEEFVPRAQAAAQRIERVIMGGHYPPGHRLGTKAELREELGIAHGTLNEALRALQMSGLIEVRPGPTGGVFVAAVDRRIRLRHGILAFRETSPSVEECMEVRDALEPLVAVEAARSHAAADIDELHGLLEEMGESRDDPRRLVAVNWALHRKLAETGRNSVLASVYCALMDFIEGELTAVETPGLNHRDVAATIRVHRNLVDAVASGDVRRAARAAAAHNPRASA